MNLFSKLFKPLPLSDAIRAGKTSHVRQHLKQGVDPNQKIDDGRVYPLYLAVAGGPDIVSLLIEHGADVSANNSRGETALHFAAAMGFLEVARCLIQAGADINARDDFGHTPLFTAVYGMAPLESIDLESGTPLSKDALQERAGRQAIAELLKSRGAAFSDADIRTSNALRSIPEAVRRTKHMALAFSNGDLDYQEAVREITMMDYPFLYDAFVALSAKHTLSDTEATFVKGFEAYERRL